VEDWRSCFAPLWHDLPGFFGQFAAVVSQAVVVDICRACSPTRAERSSSNAYRLRPCGQDQTFTPLPIELVTPPLKLRIRPPYLVYHLPRPVKVLPLSLDRPILGWGRQNIPQIADLVGQLDLFGANGGPNSCSFPRLRTSPRSGKPSCSLLSIHLFPQLWRQEFVDKGEFLAEPLINFRPTRFLPNVLCYADRHEGARPPLHLLEFPACINK